MSGLVSNGRYGIQQLACVRGVETWTFTTINCGYEHLEEAEADARRSPRFRVADRQTGRPVGGPT